MSAILTKENFNRGELLADPRRALPIRAKDWEVRNGEDPGGGRRREELRLAVTALEQAGHEVLSAQGGAEGIEAALAHAPDLILMDGQMLGMDGISALRRLRAPPRSRWSRSPRSP